MGPPGVGHPPTPSVSVTFVVARAPDERAQGGKRNSLVRPGRTGRGSAAKVNHATGELNRQSLVRLIQVDG